jgi:hypothetical protein
VAAAAVVIFIAIGGNRGPTPEEIFIARNMELLQDFDMIDHLDMLEHLDDLETMKEPS